MRSFKNRQYTMPSGIRNCWMLWRHCCCRYGLYPAAIAPIVTAGFLLSVFSSAGCRFVDVDVGFTPSNPAWNSSNTEIGLFYQYNTETADYENKYREILHENCAPYSTVFREAYISRDRTWKIARVMAFVAGGAGGLASLTSWIMVATPAPTSCLWPGLLLPSVLMAFIAEGSKFLFFDNALCRSAIWYPSGVDSLPISAESCKLGPSALYSVAAGTLQLVVLLAVCLKAPERRELDPDFGVLYTTGAEMDVEEAQDSAEQLCESIEPQGFSTSSSKSTNPPMLCDSSNYEEDSSAMDDSDVYTSGQISADVSTADNTSTTTTTASHKTTSSLLNKSTSSSNNKDEVDCVLPPSPTLADASASRLSAMSKVERKANEMCQPDKLVQELVNDLDNSFKA